MLWLLPLLPAALAPLVWFLGGRVSRGVLGAAAGSAMAATLGVAVGAGLEGWSGTYHAGGPLLLAAALDPIAAVTAIVVPAVALPVVVYAAAHEDDAGLARLLALLVLFVAAMELLVVAADLLTLLVGWELVGACSWVLIGHRWCEPERPRSATRAYLAVRLGDLGLFLAAAAAFAGNGSLAYEALPTLSPEALQVVAFGVVVAAAAKSAQLPFAPWLFAAMAGPTSVSALLHAATMVAAGAYLLARLEPALAAVPWFGPLVLGVGLITALLGGLVAALQGHAKKLLAASTSAQQGLMWLAVGAGFPAVAIAHLVTHAFFKALLFLSAGLAEAWGGSFLLGRMRAGAALPLVAACSAVGALALAGVPPLGGAWSKETVIGAAGALAPWAALLAALAGGLTAFYAARFQLLAFGRDDGGEGERTPALAERYAVVALAVASVALGAAWWPGAREAIVGALGGRPPPMHAWETWTSLGLVAFGLVAGRAAVVRRPRLGTQGTVAAAADWLGLPALARRGVVVPALLACRALARFDDAVLAAGTHGTAALARRAARVLAALDDRVVDAGVRAAARAATALARAGDACGEAASDALPAGVAGALDEAGRDLRRLHGGLTHHYYAAIATALALLVAVLAAGR